MLFMMQQMLHMLPYRMRFGVLLCYLCYNKCYTCYLIERDSEFSCVIYVTTNVTYVTLQNEIRSSLVLSMLQQMLHDDKEADVREAVVRSLGLLMGFISDPDKYQQV